MYNMFPVFNEAKHSVGNIIVLGTCHYCDLGAFPNKCKQNLTVSIKTIRDKFKQKKNKKNTFELKIPLIF